MSFVAPAKVSLKEAFYTLDGLVKRDLSDIYGDKLIIHKVKDTFIKSAEVISRVITYSIKN